MKSACRESTWVVRADNVLTVGWKGIHAARCLLLQHIAQLHALYAAARAYYPIRLLTCLRSSYHFPSLTFLALRPLPAPDAGMRHLTDGASSSVSRAVANSALRRAQHNRHSCMRMLTQAASTRRRFTQRDNAGTIRLGRQRQYTAGPPIDTMHRYYISYCAWLRCVACCHFFSLYLPPRLFTQHTQHRLTSRSPARLAGMLPAFDTNPISALCHYRLLPLAATLTVAT